MKNREKFFFSEKNFFLLTRPLVIFMKKNIFKKINLFENLFSKTLFKISFFQKHFAENLKVFLEKFPKFDIKYTAFYWKMFLLFFLSNL